MLQSLSSICAWREPLRDEPPRPASARDTRKISWNMFRKMYYIPLRCWPLEAAGVAGPDAMPGVLERAGEGATEWERARS